MKDRTTRSWGTGSVSAGADGRFVARGPGIVCPEGSEDKGNSGAGSVHGAYQPDIVMIVKMDGTILFLNRSVPDAADGTVLGDSILAYIDAAHRNTVREVIARVFAEGEPGSFVCTGMPPFAVDAWYHCRVAPNQRNGAVVSATVIARDITQWKRSEDEFKVEIEELRSKIDEISAVNAEMAGLLADQERREKELTRFRKLMDQAGEAIFIIEPETGRFIDVNETACSWLRHPRERLLTMGVRDLDLDFPLETPSGVADHVTDTRDANRPRIYDTGSHRRCNGTSFPVEVALVQRRVGDREYILVVARDTKQRRWTEQTARESENKYRSLFDLSRDAIYCSARDGSVADVNDSAIDLFGYTRAEFIGLEARKLYKSPEDIRGFQRGVSENGSIRNLPVEFVAKSGKPFRGLLAAALRTDGEGNVQGYQCVISPMDERGFSALERVEGDKDASERSERSPERNTVVVAAREKWMVDDVRTVLERADIEVMTARTAAAAVEMLRPKGDGIGVVLFDFAPDDLELQAALSEVKQICPAVQVVLFEDENSRGGALARADAVVRKPLHPLALVQQVRESLVASRHQRSDS